MEAPLIMITNIMIMVVSGRVLVTVGRNLRRCIKSLNLITRVWTRSSIVLSLFVKLLMMVVIDYYSGTNLGGDASQWKDGRCHLGQLIIMNMSCHLFHNFDQMMIFMFIIHPRIWRYANQRLVESSQWSSLGWEVCKQVESPFVSMTIMIMILRCWWIQNWSALPRWHDNGNQDHDK